MNRADAISSVLAELESTTYKFPAPFHSAHEGFAVLKEEVDELWDEVKLPQHLAARNEYMRCEAIQVAAMAIRFLLDCTGDT